MNKKETKEAKALAIAEIRVRRMLQYREDNNIELTKSVKKKILELYNEMILA